MTMPPAGPAQQTEPKRNWIQRHPVLSGLGALVVLIGGAGALGDSGGSSAVTGKIVAEAGASAAPTPTMASGAPEPANKDDKPEDAQPGKITFVVTGHAPGGADIGYGSDSDNRSGNSGTKNGMPSAKLPWKATMKIADDALYYGMHAQLQGGGDIDCKIIVGGKTVAKGHAQGDYNICDVQASKDIFGNWSAQ